MKLRVEYRTGVEPCGLFGGDGWSLSVINNVKHEDIEYKADERELRVYDNTPSGRQLMAVYNHIINFTLVAK